MDSFSLLYPVLTVRIQTLFFDKDIVLGAHWPGWLVDRFFYESIGLSYTTIVDAFDRSAPPMQKATMRDVIERRITKARC